MPCESYPEGSQRDLEMTAGDWLSFAAGQDDLDQRGQESVHDQAHWLLHNPDVRVAVLGYADEGWSRGRHKKLASRRANRVRDYLIAYGVTPDRIEIFALGKGYWADPADRDHWNHGVHLVAFTERNAK
jgi:peptidoglycan-associated lipoprotein